MIQYHFFTPFLRESIAERNYMKNYTVIEVREWRGDHIALVVKNDLTAPERFIVVRGLDINSLPDPIWYGGGTYFSYIRDAVDYFEERTLL